MISLVLPNLMTWDGERPVIGGLERLAWALIHTAQEAGYRIDVHQNGSHDWTRTYKGVTITGHGLARLSPVAALESIHHKTHQCLYFSIMQQPIPLRPGSLVVSHGVWWDAPRMAVQSQLTACETALQDAAEIVSVDYNFLNVMRAVYPGLAHKISVIPNFVDTDQFTPPPNPRPDPPMILFPRRIDPARGLELFIQSIGPVFEAHADVRAILSVDQNNPTFNDGLRAQIAAWPHHSRLHLTSTTFDQMPALYRQAGIVVIPSTFSEGTSMSCLEAMASGCAVVASDVGGLTNLIISGFNGVMVPPKSQAVSGALLRLVRNAAWRRELGDHARLSTYALGKGRWEQAWLEALNRVYGPPRR